MKTEAYYEEFAFLESLLPYEDAPLESVYYLPHRDQFMMVRLAEEDYLYVTLGDTFIKPVEDYYKNNLVKKFILFEDAILLGYL
jgi:hypothetical protein